MYLASKWAISENTISDENDYENPKSGHREEKQPNNISNILVFPANNMKNTESQFQKINK